MSRCCSGHDHPCHPPLPRASGPCTQLRHCTPLGMKDKRMLHSHHGPEAPDLSTPRMALHLRAVLALPPPTVLIAPGVYSPVAFVCLASGTSCPVFADVDASRPHISGTPTADCYDIPPMPHTADPSVHLGLRSHRLIAILRLGLNDLCEEGRAQGLGRSHAWVVRPEPSL